MLFALQSERLTFFVQKRTQRVGVDASQIRFEQEASSERPQPLARLLTGPRRVHPDERALALAPGAGKLRGVH